MNSIARKQIILQELQDKGNVNIVEMAEKLGVSSMTIRRDLVKFSKEGLVTLEYGGAVLNSGSLFEYSMVIKQREYIEEKKRIAKKCLEYINEGDSIFLDAGSTVAEIAKLIANKKNINVLTHSLLAANILSKANNIKLIMCPGVFRERSMAFMGQMTDEFVSGFKIDKLFLSVEGIDNKLGITVPDITDGDTKRTLINEADSVICVADSSKFDKRLFYSIAPLSAIDILITDNNANAETVEAFKKEIKKVEIV